MIQYTFPLFKYVTVLCALPLAVACISNTNNPGGSAVPPCDDNAQCATDQTCYEAKCVPLTDDLKDEDGDGYRAMDDCDDNDATVWEMLSGFVDADADGNTIGEEVQVCSGGSDPTADATLPDGYQAGASISTDINDDPANGGADVWQVFQAYVDADGDTYTVGDVLTVNGGDTLPMGYSLTKSTFDDCDDTNAMLWETLNGFADADGDGYTVSARTALCSGGADFTLAAVLPTGYLAAVSTPIDINDDFNNGGASEWKSYQAYVDADGDTYTVGGVLTVNGGDALPTGYAEIRSSTEDCNDDPDAGGATVWENLTGYADKDGDTYTLAISEMVCSGSLSGVVTHATVLPSAYLTAANGDDCDDGVAGDQTALDAAALVWTTSLPVYVDADSDGVGVGSALNTICSNGTDAPTGYLLTSSGTPNDCDDDAVTGPLIWQWKQGYLDKDGDGYGTGAFSYQCSGADLPTGYSANNSDCNDGIVGDQVSLDAAALVWQNLVGYADKDGDGYGVDPVDNAVCSGSTLLDGYAANNTDCDDGVTGDQVSLDAAALVWQNLAGYIDVDQDGYGIFPIDNAVCSGLTLASTHVDNSLDCIDTNPMVNPDQWERFDDTLDNDCDGVTNVDMAAVIYVDGTNGVDVATADLAVNPNNRGTQVLPVKTIQNGIDLATAQGLSAVVVAAGTYLENVTLAPDIDLFGGYDSANSWVRDPAVHVTTIKGADTTTLTPIPNTNINNLVPTVRINVNAEVGDTYVNGFTLENPTATTNYAGNKQTIVRAVSTYPNSLTTFTGHLYMTELNLHGVGQDATASGLTRADQIRAFSFEGPDNKTFSTTFSRSEILLDGKANVALLYGTVRNGGNGVAQIRVYDSVIRVYDPASNGYANGMVVSEYTGRVFNSVIDVQSNIAVNTSVRGWGVNGFLSVTHSTVLLKNTVVTGAVGSALAVVLSNSAYADIDNSLFVNRSGLSADSTFVFKRVNITDYPGAYIHNNLVVNFNGLVNALVGDGVAAVPVIIKGIANMEDCSQWNGCSEGSGNIEIAAVTPPATPDPYVTAPTQGYVSRDTLGVVSTGYWQVNSAGAQANLVIDAGTDLSQHSNPHGRFTFPKYILERLAVDFLGNARPQGTAPDLGAQEIQ